MDVRPGCWTPACLQALNKFQCEIGQHILKLSKYHAIDAIRIGLHWPTVATCILSRKLPFLSKLLSNPEDTMSSHIFTTLATEDVYSISIVQQCRMLDDVLATDIVNQCLTTPDDAVSIVRSGKNLLLQ